MIPVLAEAEKNIKNAAVRIRKEKLWNLWILQLFYKRDGKLSLQNKEDNDLRQKESLVPVGKFLPEYIL